MAKVSLSGLCVATLVLVTCSIAALGLLSVRITRTDDPHFAFLTWNLFLAWIPFVVAVALYGAHRAAAGWLWLGFGFVAWLLFLPNAPYLVTDYIHLAADARVPLWFDFALLGAFSVSGLLLGFASVYLVQAVVTERLGTFAGWAATGAVFVLSAVGIYVGRVLRFNSWDAVQEPGPLVSLALARLEDPLGNPLLVATVVVFTAFLTLAYVGLYMTSLALMSGWRALGSGPRHRA
ncbi:MAG: DUF1361 domain-containing protein [Dehalococcoidia bacterium]